MVSNYRKSPGRFGEIGDEGGIERPPVRPSIAFPNARNVLHVPAGTKSADRSIENSYSTPTTSLYLSTTDADDMSSLGDDPSILEILFAASPVKVVASDEVQPSDSQNTSRTMTTLMDLFHPAESPSGQDLQWNTAITDQGTQNSELRSDVVEKKKKKKKKKLSDENGAETAIDATEKKKKKKKKKSKDEKSKTKVSKSREDTTCTKAKKNESLDRKKKTSSPSDTPSPSDTTSPAGEICSTEPMKKEKKKRRKSDASPPELNVDKRQERKQKKSSKGENVVPSLTRQEQIRKGSASKGKSTRREKSPSHNDSSPNFTPATKDTNGHKNHKGKGASDDCTPRVHCSNETKNSISPLLRDSSMLVPEDEKADDYSFDERSFFSCARSTFTYDCFDLPDSTKKYSAGKPTIPTECDETPHMTLELAIAAVPKERATERNQNVPKKSKGLFLKRIFGEGQSN